MTKTYFEVIRPGINSTFQDMGRNNLYHIGIPFSGAMDNRNYILSNRLVGNNLESPALEFAYQGPLLRYQGDRINIAITGDVNFTIKKNENLINGRCYESFILENGDELDILSTNKSVVQACPSVTSSIQTTFSQSYDSSIKNFNLFNTTSK